MLRHAHLLGDLAYCQTLLVESPDLRVIDEPQQTANAALFLRPQQMAVDVNSASYRAGNRRTQRIFDIGQIRIENIRLRHHRWICSPLEEMQRRCRKPFAHATHHPVRRSLAGVPELGLLP
jgi:hypothetical protein